MPSLYAAFTSEGLLFAHDVRTSIRHRVSGAVEDLATEGRDMVQAYLVAGIANPTGDTVSLVEAHSYATGRYASGSLFAKVRMAPGHERGGSATRPYIIAHVLESGGYGGVRAAGGRGRRRAKWQRGKAQQRHAIHEFRNAYRDLKVRANDVRADLTADL